MQSPKIVAELSANHGGSLETALATVHAAAESGADAIKLQTYTPDSLTLDVKAPDFCLKGGLWDNRWLYDLYREACTPYEWHEAIFNAARAAGLECFSTPFDKEGVDLLESLGNPIYKIASFEAMDLELISYAASKGKPIVISTGIATDREIYEAITTCRNAGNDDITLLKCTSAYPASPADANLAMIQGMRDRYGVKIGLSDHSAGSDVPVVATSLGAIMIEKHFILDRNIGGPDAAFSMNPSEFSDMVKRVRDVVAHPDTPPSTEWDYDVIMGSVDFDRAGKSDGRKWARSLYVSAPIAPGEPFTRDNVRCVRPGYSLHPRHFTRLLEKRADKAYSPGDRIEILF